MKGEKIDIGVTPCKLFSNEVVELFFGLQNSGRIECRLWVWTIFINLADFSYSFVLNVESLRLEIHKHIYLGDRL